MTDDMTRDDWWFRIDTALALDAVGAPHVVAGSRKGIWHFTKKDSGWQGELVSTAPAGGYDGQPAIAVAADGSIGVVFARYTTWSCDEFGCDAHDPSGVKFVAAAANGDWSEPATVFDGPGFAPSIALAPIGFQIAFEAIRENDDSIHFAASDGADWKVTEIANHGTDPLIAARRDGTPILTYLDTTDQLAGYAKLIVAQPDAGGGSTRTRGPLLQYQAAERYYLSAVGPDDRLNIVSGNDFYLRVGVDWSDPVGVFSGEELLGGGLTVGADGRPQVISDTSVAALWYATGHDGQFESQQLAGEDSGGTGHRQAVATDAAGKVHVVYKVTSTVGDYAYGDLAYVTGG